MDAAFGGTLPLAQARIGPIIGLQLRVRTSTRTSTPEASIYIIKYVYINFCAYRPIVFYRSVYFIDYNIKDRQFPTTDYYAAPAGSPHRPRAITIIKRTVKMFQFSGRKTKTRSTLPRIAINKSINKEPLAGGQFPLDKSRLEQKLVADAAFKTAAWNISEATAICFVVTLTFARPVAAPVDATILIRFSVSIPIKDATTFLEKPKCVIQTSELTKQFTCRLCAAAVSLLLGRIGRCSGRKIARSVFSFGRSPQAERDNESWFFCARADRSWERRKAFGGPLSRSVTHRYVTERYTFSNSERYITPDQLIHESVVDTTNQYCASAVRANTGSQRSSPHKSSDIGLFST
ncbi:hypothetical protein EVAR_14639_1 [Eumeta japonica]|uniref:Uncharacterized protein n=1 Tax=Eumeta variegata TaxID=151549 RepID=A0A4C1U2A1_EUMVA|nr:hypothetical protein EVAR_14639_1 [Eumeta japonica]